MLIVVSVFATPPFRLMMEIVFILIIPFFNVFHWNTWLSIAAVCPQSYRAFSFRRVLG